MSFEHKSEASCSQCHNVQMNLYDVEMKNILELIGSKVRRVSFSIQNGKDHYLLLSVIEEMLPDMQDYDDFPQCKTCVYRSDSSNSAKTYNIYMAVDWITLDEAFLSDPVNNYVVGGTTYLFYSDEYRLRPSKNEPPFVMQDSYHDNKPEIQNVLPLRQCTKALYSYIVKDNVVAGILEVNDYLKKQLKEVSTKYYGTDLSLFPDHFGNIYIVQYNPYFKHVDFSSSEEPFGLYVNFKFRQIELTELIIRVSSKNKAGFYSFEIDEMVSTDKSNHYIKLPAAPDVLSVKIFDKYNNLIYFSDSMSFIKSINFSMDVKSKDVKLITKEGKSEKEETVEKFVTESHSIGEKYDGDAIYGEAQTKNAYLTLEQSLQFILFDGDQTKKEENIKRAKSVVKQILGKAHNRCIICDPYFNLSDLAEFVFTMKSLSVNVRIMSAKEFIGKNAEQGKKNAIAIHEAIVSYVKRVGGNIQFRLLTGQSPLHDRFIVADDQVWLLGSSFNEFGNRVTTITKVPQQSCRRVYSMAEEWWSDTKKTISLEDYGRS